LSKKLVIVESPAKAKTIGRYLGKDYEVTSSKGHIRDLPESEFGVDLNSLTPTYRILKGKEKVVKQLKEKAKGKEVLLASDMDREGEAIAWHVAQILGLPKTKKNRIIFSEITENAIKRAVKNPRTIDMNKVNAQVARRILDRIVGYKLSPLLWKTVSRGLSAGRVQTVALKFISDLESKIAAFKPHKFYKIFMRVGEQKIQLLEINGKKFSNKSIRTEEERDKTLNELKQSVFVVSSIETTRKKIKPPEPFITSTMQQTAINELGWSASKTMKVAQQLYEGIDTPEGHIAFITYMRTDSTRISEEAKEKAKVFILEKFGEKYLGTAKTKKSRKKNVQDAHEAIRPTYPERTPEEVKAKKLLSGDHLRLYTLVWKRFFASQMAAAEYDVTTVKIADENGKYIFKYTTRNCVFDGFERILKKTNSNHETAIVPEGKTIKPDTFLWEEDQTKPPARYTEASLVRELEKKGIGRPSTYATIISTLLERKYVVKSGRELRPTLLGNIVADFLGKSFPDIINEKFTANMEEELDEIENAKRQWKEVVLRFYENFAQDLNKLEQDIKNGKLKIEYPTDRKCDCGGEFKVVFGRYGGYLKCSECGKNQSLDMTVFAPIIEGKVILHDIIETNNKKNELDETCPECGSKLVIRKGRYGSFIACSAYPKCTYTRDIYVDAKCPECGGSVKKMRSKKGKTYFKCVDCGKMFWREPADKKCEVCGDPLFFKFKRGSKKVLYCEKCKKEFPINE